MRVMSQRHAVCNGDDDDCQEKLPSGTPGRPCGDHDDGGKYMEGEGRERRAPVTNRIGQYKGDSLSCVFE